jgi:O-antigen/teichoic acid export membrane protein
MMTRDQFVDAAPIVAWTSLGVFFYGVYLLTSIGLNITSQTRYYPVSTLAGAAANVGLNIALIPTYGMLGAAWANAAAYALQSGIAYRFSQRFYPIRYERGRLARASGAAAIAYAVAIALPAMPPLAGVILRGSTVMVVMGGLLAMTGFFHANELRWLRSLPRGRVDLAVKPAETTEMAGEIVSVEIPDDLIAAREKEAER